MEVTTTTKEDETEVRRSALQRKKRAQSKLEECDKKRQNQLNSTIMHSIYSFKQLLNKTFRFTANSSLPTWKNIQNILLNTRAKIYFCQPSSQAIFNLSNLIAGLPIGTLSLLSLGLKFCLRATHPTNKINLSLNQFEINVRVKYLMKDKEEHNKFIPQLYI